MKKWVSLLLLCVTVSCSDKKPDFILVSPTPEAAASDLSAFLRQVPFSGEWNPDKGQDDKVVFTNVQNVFPNRGRFYNAEDTFSAQPRHNKQPDDYHQKETVLYKDPEWGELFVFGMLIYQYQPLFLRQEESESANVLFTGANSYSQRDSVMLAETSLVSQSDQSRSAVYIAGSYGRRALQYVFQRGQLVVQVAIPWGQHSDEEVLERLKQVVTALNPADKPVLEAGTAALAPNPEPVSFWQDPYLDVRPPERGAFMPLISLRLRITPFKEENIPAVKKRQADISWSYQGDKGEVWFAVNMERSDNKAEEAAAKQTWDRTLSSKRGNTIYVNEQIKDGYHTGAALMYDYSYFYSRYYRIIMRYGYPEEDQTAATLTEGLLTSVK